MAGADPAIAIDIGGTKMAVGLVEPGGRLIASARTGTPREQDAEQLWRTLDVLAGQVLAAAGLAGPGAISGVGCGCGGPMEWPSGKVSPISMAIAGSAPATLTLQCRRRTTRSTR